MKAAVINIMVHNDNDSAFGVAHDNDELFP